MSSPLLHRGPAPLDTVRHLVELAGRAPSIGNTQPWAWRTDGSRLELLADHTRRLEPDDPHGRQLVISCGAALHHLRVAARALGTEAHVALADPDSRPDPDGLVLLAGVELRPGGEERERGAADLHLLRSRHTDRQRFTSWPISPERLRRLARAAQRPEVQAVPVVGAGRKTQLDALVQESARALTVAATGLAVDLPERDPGGQIESDDGVLVLTGGADDVATWLSVGEALSDLWLEATRQGLAVVPLCAPIESPATRALVARTLPPEAGVPHLVLRISWGALGHSHLADPARRSVDDVLRATWDEGPARSMPTASHHRAPGRPE